MQNRCRCTEMRVNLGVIDAFSILNVRQSQEHEESFVRNQPIRLGDLCPPTVLPKYRYLWSISITVVIIRRVTENSKSRL